MEPKAKLTKEMICEEARFILANVLAEGRYGKQNHFEDIRRICEGAVSLGLQEYVSFLENYGYLTYDRRSDVLDVTPEGERVVSGEKTQDLMARVVQHFMRQGAAGQSAAPQATPRRRFVQSGSQAPRDATQPPPSRDDDDEVPTAGPERVGQARAATSPDGREILDRRYEKLVRIGTGGIGTVWKARQITLDREVAVKEVRELFALVTEDQRREIQRRFGEVVRQAARLSHPNIMPLLDVNSERENPYMVMEFATHGNLRRIIRDAEDIPVALSIKYFLQVLHALRAAHDQGVIHRGLKPENILLDRYGNARLGDFGTARIVERDKAVIQHVYVGMGAPSYMAPELFSDPLGSGAQADIYALGIILYELLTRKIPGRRSPMPSESAKGLPRTIDDIFDRMTRDSRDERYKSCEEVLNDFYKADDIAAVAELKGSILFFKSPLETLKFKETAPPPIEEPAPVIAAPPAATAAAGDGATGPASPVPPAVTPAPEGDKPEVTGQSRAIGRRPYSFQQRLKDRDKE
jgi:serine/threonine protein kinase